MPTKVVHGPSHANGGVDFYVAETGRTYNLEGDELIITGLKLSDSTVQTLTGTNAEIIFHLSKFSGEAEELLPGDIVICKRAVSTDEVVHSYTGTPKEIIQQISMSCGCNDPFKPAEKKSENGGVIISHGGYQFPEGYLPSAVLNAWLDLYKAYCEKYPDYNAPRYTSYTEFEENPFEMARVVTVAEIHASMSNIEFPYKEYLYEDYEPAMHIMRDGGKVSGENEFQKNGYNFRDGDPDIISRDILITTLSKSDVANQVRSLFEDEDRTQLQPNVVELENGWYYKRDLLTTRKAIIVNAVSYEAAMINYQGKFGIEYLLSDFGKLNPRTSNKQNATHEKPKYVDKKLHDDQDLLQKYPVLTKKLAKENYEKVISILSNNPAMLSEDERYALELFEGQGGQASTGKTSVGILHQYYTPYVLAKKMWELAQHYGFKGGQVTEPSCGTGRFFKFAPAGTSLYGFDPDQQNAQIIKILYPDVKFYQQGFETAFLQEPRFNKKANKSWLPEMDLVIGNPPYGDYIGYYKSFMPSLYKRFEFLFIRKGLELLKPGGLLVFIVSQNIMNNGAAYNGMKEDILKIGEFVDSYRMPNGIFSTTEVGTDIVIFRKKSAASKMEDGGMINIEIMVELYHGSIVDFDEFDETAVLTGEGSDAFGKGFYLTDSLSIAEFYAQHVAKNLFIDHYQGGGILGTQTPVFMDNADELAKGKAVINKFEFTGKVLHADTFTIDEEFKNVLQESFKKHVGISENHVQRAINYARENKSKIHKYRGELIYVIEQIALDPEIKTDIISYLKEKGYDAIKYATDPSFEGPNGNNYLVFNKSSLKKIR